MKSIYQVKIGEAAVLEIAAAAPAPFCPFCTMTGSVKNFLARAFVPTTGAFAQSDGAKQYHVYQYVTAQKLLLYLLYLLYLRRNI